VAGQQSTSDREGVEMTTISTDTITIFCRAKEASDAYEAEVAPDLSVRELVIGLNEDRYLPNLAAGERWRVVHARTNSDLTPSAKLDQSSVKDGDQLELDKRPPSLASICIGIADACYSKARGPQFEAIVSCRVVFTAPF
jgi:hypothetical protein